MKIVEVNIGLVGDHQDLYIKREEGMVKVVSLSLAPGSQDEFLVDYRDKSSGKIKTTLIDRGTYIYRS